MKNDFSVLVFTHAAHGGMILHDKLFAICRNLQNFSRFFVLIRVCFFFLPFIFSCLAHEVCFFYLETFCFGAMSNGLPVWPSLHRTSDDTAAAEHPATVRVSFLGNFWCLGLFL